VDSGTRNTRTDVRAALRVVAAVLAALVAVGLSPAVAAAAPSDAEIAAAKAAANAVSDRIGDLTAELTKAQETVDRLRAESTIALDEYQATQAAYQAAQQQSAAAEAAAMQAAAALGVARADVVAFARRSYMDGSSYAGAAALITAGDPGELIERAALLEAAGSHRSDVLDTVTVLQEQADQADQAARTALVQVTVLQEEAATELAVAQAAEVSAREQAAELSTQQAQLETELASAQQELVALVGAREAADRTARVAPPVPSAPPAAPPAPSGNQEQAGPGNASAIQTAIEEAMSHLGLPYAWGGGGRAGPGAGQDPDLGIVGFDCSGLTQYAYAQAGISIPRNSRAQYSSLPKVASDDLRPGDLVFWATTPTNPQTIHHVALYIGNGEVVHAPESGDVVKVSDMWWRGYAGAARPSA
jgi:cell wall-associated NlpC family hydrolase